MPSMFRQALVVAPAPLSAPLRRRPRTASPRWLFSRDRRLQGRCRTRRARCPGRCARPHCARAAFGGGGGVELPSPAVAALSRNPNVEFVEEDAKRYPLALTTPSTSPYASGQLEPWGIRAVQADLLPLGDALTGNRKVCIIDSATPSARGPAGTSRVSGYNGNLAWSQDGSGHGTHVAGTIAALNNAGTGVVGVNAAAPQPLHRSRVGDSGAWPTRRRWSMQPRAARTPVPT